MLSKGKFVWRHKPQYIRLAQRERNDEGAALAECALYGDVSPVQLSDVLGDSQTKTVAVRA